MKVTDIPAIMTFKECKNVLKIGKGTLLELLHSGELQGFRVGTRWRITRDQLIDYINER